MLRNYLAGACSPTPIKDQKYSYAISSNIQSCPKATDTVASVIMRSILHRHPKQNYIIENMDEVNPMR